MNIQIGHYEAAIDDAGKALLENAGLLNGKEIDQTLSHAMAFYGHIIPWRQQGLVLTWGKPIYPAVGYPDIQKACWELRVEQG